MKENTLLITGKYRSLLLVLLASLFALVLGWITAEAGMAAPLAFIGLAFSIPLFIVFFNLPRWGIYTAILVSFFITAAARYITDGIFQYTSEAILLVCWLGVLSRKDKTDFSPAKRDIVYLGLAWFAITVLQLLNPAGGSILGWISDSRYPFLWLLSVPLIMMFLKKEADINRVLIVMIAASLVAALYGVVQLKVGLSAADKAFLEAGAAKTHILFGQLRVFSIYQDAGQFGASMAHLAVISLILAMGPFRWWKKLVCLLAAAAFVYAMLISGTRGALYVLLVGMLVALLVYKNLKIFIVAGFFLAGSFVFLKYTTYLQGNAQVRRMRTALDPNDASLQVRLKNQEKLRYYLRDKPFGGGVGTIGYAGTTYNPDKYLAQIPPDSYWVKVWAMYGIVGLVLWFGIMMYILGKTCGIVWSTNEKGLKFKLGALTAGGAGIFVASFGNEVMNNMPSAMILYTSWALIFSGPYLQHKKTGEHIDG